MADGGAAPVTRRETRRQEIKQRLLDAIEHLTADGESYATVSVDRLAAHAGISRATFYLYFSEKKALLNAWLEDVRGHLNEVLAAWPEVVGADVTRHDVELGLRRLATVYRAHATLIEAVYNEAARDSGTRDVLERLVWDSIAALRVQIERGQQEGCMDPALLPGETAAWLIWSLQSGLRDLVAPSTEAETALLVDAHAAIWWHVLYAAA